jgi:hypothetical protein
MVVNSKVLKSIEDAKSVKCLSDLKSMQTLINKFKDINNSIDWPIQLVDSIEHEHILNSITYLSNSVNNIIEYLLSRKCNLTVYPNK